MTIDTASLCNEQYRDASNLDARKALHQRFSTNTNDWFRWLFDHFDLPPTAALLELGTGPADLWQRNLERLPPGWSITLSDFSPGMLDAARVNLGPAHPRFLFRAIDAQEIPLADGSLDAVVANHMLYHVPDRSLALAEIRRVLKPGGTLYAATNSADNMRRLAELIQSVSADPVQEWSWVTSLPFTLENGADQLHPFFHRVTLHRREDALVVTEVEPLVAYVRSTQTFAGQPVQLAALRERFAEEIRQHGAIHIAKDVGLFVAQT